MKKKSFLLLILIGITTLFSCSSDESDGNNSRQLKVEDIIGEWVYDHPEEGIWEKQKFMSSGVFYYSNTSLGGWKFSNDSKDGRYSVENDNRITMNVVLGGVTTKLMLKVLEITDYAYTAEYTNGNASVGIFTYAKQVGNITVKPGEAYTPSCSQSVKANIKGYASHDETIAKVNSNDGTITAISAGHTYIDIITDQGTAVYEVTVFDDENMFEDYSFAFGKTIQEIVDLKGTDYIYRDDKNGLVYYSTDYLTDTIKYITGAYDKTHVEYVQLYLNDKISKSKIKQYLDGKYELLSLTDNKYSYVTDKSIDGNPIAAIYDSNSSIISFAQILPSDRWTDFSYLFGQTKALIKSEMDELNYTFNFSDYSYSKDGSDYYSLNDSRDAYLVGFVFNSEGKMCEYWVYLNENDWSNVNDILTWLKSKYILNKQESSSTQMVFYDKLNRMKIVFDASGFVSYTDSEQSPFTPASSSYNAIGVKAKKFQVKFGY